MKRHSNSTRLAAGCFLVASSILIPGCRSAQVKMPSWPWRQSAEMETESAPVETPYTTTIVPNASGESLPAPPQAELNFSQPDSTRVPPAPAPMPDEHEEHEEGEQALPGPIEPDSHHEGEPSSNSKEEYFNPQTEQSSLRTKSSSDKQASKKRLIPFGHVPLEDRSESAEELKVPSPRLSGKLPRISPHREILPTRF